MHPLTRSTPQKRTLNVSLRQLLHFVNSKNVRVLTSTTLVVVELWRQWQTLIFPLFKPPRGDLGPVFHEARAPQGSYMC